MTRNNWIFAASLITALAIPLASPAEGISSLEQRFVGQLSLCEAYEFSSKGLLAKFNDKKGAYLKEQVLASISDWKWARLVKVSELPAGMLEKNTRKTLVIPHHPAIVKGLTELSILMTRENKYAVSMTEVREAADARLVNELTGERARCYRIFTYTPWSFKARTVGVTESQQVQITELFDRAHDAVRAAHFLNDAPLSTGELQLLNAQRLTPAELMELRALRRATGLLEKMTPLRGDVGGWMGNMLNEIIPLKKNQMNCVAETETFIDFARSLIDQNLLRHFSVERLPAYRSLIVAYHIAVQLRNKRTNQIFVLDSWHEHAGQPAHITTLEDWLQRNDDHDVTGALTIQ